MTDVDADDTLTRLTDLSPACKDIPGDLIFLIDSSGSIQPNEYSTMKDFMKSIITKSVIGMNEVHVGVMQFSTDARLHFPLNRYHSKEELYRAIDGMTQFGGGTHTGAALQAVAPYFDLTNGGRPELTQRLMVITDGESQDAVKNPAAALRAKGVVVYAIGVVDANTTQLLEISGSSDRTFSEKDFDALKNLENQVALKICETDEGKSEGWAVKHQVLCQFNSKSLRKHRCGY